MSVTFAKRDGDDFLAGPTVLARDWALSQEDHSAAPVDGWDAYPDEAAAREALGFPPADPDVR